MYWDMIGALAEFVGAAAFVATLFYLTHQVGEASREAQPGRWSELHNQLSLVADCRSVVAQQRPRGC